MTICFVHKNKIYADTTIGMGAYTLNGYRKIFQEVVLHEDGHTPLLRTIAVSGEMHLITKMVDYWLRRGPLPEPCLPSEGYAELIVADSLDDKPVSVGIVTSLDSKVLTPYPIISTLIIGREADALATRALLEADVDPEQVIVILDKVSAYKFKGMDVVEWCDLGPWEGKAYV